MSLVGRDSRLKWLHGENRGTDSLCSLPLVTIYHYVILNLFIKYDNGVFEETEPSANPLSRVDVFAIVDLF